MAITMVQATITSHLNSHKNFITCLPSNVMLQSKSEHPLMIKKKKTLQEVGIERNYLNIVKAIYDLHLKSYLTLESLKHFC